MLVYTHEKNERLSHYRTASETRSAQQENDGSDGSAHPRRYRRVLEQEGGKMKLRSNKPAVLAALAAGTILGGWPDRITNGVAIEDKRGGDILSASQIACHEWLKKVTGRYPLIHYTDKHLKLHVFRSYKEFYKWRAKDWTHCPASVGNGESVRPLR